MAAACLACRQTENPSPNALPSSKHQGIADKLQGSRTLFRTLMAITESSPGQVPPTFISLQSSVIPDRSDTDVKYRR